MKTIQRPPKPHKALIDPSVFSSHLAHLGICATGEYAYLKLNLESLGLESIQGIEKFPLVQHINLSYNKLITLKPLSKLKNLLTIDVSKNNLTQLLDFDPPANLLNVNAAFNFIKTFGKVAKNQFLQKINLDSNQITEITGIEELPNLQYLSINNNKILKISGIPISLQYLDLANNEISRIGLGFSKLIFLRIIDLSYNKISSLKGVEDLESLMILKLKGNLIRKVNTLDHLIDLALLTELDLSENLVCEKEHYRLRVAYKLPQISTLDSLKISAEEKIKAENLYGLDIEDRKALFNQIFPGQMFIDRRLITSEMLDIESLSEEEDEYVHVKTNSDSKYPSRTLSKINSRENIDPMSINEVLLFSKRYVGELIERAEQERSSRVSFKP